MPKANQKEESGFDGKLADGVTRAIRTLGDYAVENLPFLIFDQEGNVREDSRAQEAFELLKQINREPEQVTNDEIAQALERLATKSPFKTEWIDEIISNLDLKMRLLVAGGFAAGKTLLKVKKEYVKELQQKREKLLLLCLQHPSTITSYELLLNKPHLTRFIMTYVCLRLGVQLPQEKTVAPVQAVQRT